MAGSEPGRPMNAFIKLAGIYCRPVLYLAAPSDAVTQLWSGFVQLIISVRSCTGSLWISIHFLSACTTLHVSACLNSGMFCHTLAGEGALCSLLWPQTLSAVLAQHPLFQVAHQAAYFRFDC